MFMIFVLFAHSWIGSVQISIQDRNFRTLHFALENAVHDAAMYIDKEKFSEGIIDLDAAKGHANFIETLQKNLPVDANLAPTHDYFLEKPLEIIEFHYFDDLSVDPDTGLNLNFPFIFTYEDASKGIKLDRVINGPSAVYVVEAQMIGNDTPTPFIKIQEYKK